MFQLYPSIVFTFRFAVESTKEFGGASLWKIQKNIQGNKYKIGIRYRTNRNAFNSCGAWSMRKHDGFECGMCDSILCFDGFNHSIKFLTICLFVIIHTLGTHVRWSSNPIKVNRWNFMSFAPNVASVENGCCNPTLRECEDETHTLEMGTWEPSETLKISEFDYRGQNTLHWGVFYIIGRLKKCRCRKWVHMGHLEICRTSYGKKKGRESNWQFNSWPLKVGSQPDLGTCRWSAIHYWKALKDSYKFDLDLNLIGGWSA